MDKVININGVEYIQKAEYDKAKNDIDTIRKFVSSSITDLSKLVNVAPLTQKSEQLITQVSGKSVIQRHSKRSKHIKFNGTNGQKYSIENMNKEGKFSLHEQRRPLDFSIHEVAIIDKRYTETMTMNDVKQLARELHISSHTVMRIIYNIDAGVFDTYINLYISQLNKKIDFNKEIPIENNPEKRRNFLQTSS